MGDRQAKDALFDGLAEVARAMANGRRAELVDVLDQGERHVDDLAQSIGQSVANTSFHLRALAGAGLVATRREGTRIYYRLATPEVSRLWRSLRSIAAARVDAVDALTAAYLGDRRGVEEIDQAELARRLEDENLVILDVRPAAEFRSGHVRGARSIPIEDLADHIRDLPPGSEVVAYCRGPFCVFADDAVRMLMDAGVAARRLADGYPEWRDADLPVTVDGPRPDDA